MSILATWPELGIAAVEMSTPGENPRDKARSEYGRIKELFTRGLEKGEIPPPPKRFSYRREIKGLTLVDGDGMTVCGDLFKILQHEFRSNLKRAS